eukprot:4186182-Pyramimonas_sp.AAC.2
MPERVSGRRGLPGGARGAPQWPWLCRPPPGGNAPAQGALSEGRETARSLDRAKARTGLKGGIRPPSLVSAVAGPVWSAKTS